MMGRFLPIIFGLTLFGCSRPAQNCLDLEGQTEAAQHFRDVIGQTISLGPSITCDMTLCQEVETTATAVLPGTVVSNRGDCPSLGRLMKTGYFSVTLSPWVRQRARYPVQGQAR